MSDILSVLMERGFFAQCTNEEGLRERLASSSVSFYVGCDPTASSLHIGHMVPFFAFRHLINAGHKGIALAGGGTARIGDPSGKTELRKMLSYEDIDRNVEAITKQLDRFLGFDGKRAQLVNNKDWLKDLNYIDFLRDIGSCFSVNKMLSFEAYKLRLERGLSFIEFNYQLLQAYDFLMLHKTKGAVLEIGGDDQWGNITAGVDLIRRKLGGTSELNKEHEVFGLTFPLVVTADGKKMGKTEAGAVFLESAITSVFDFFQYWRNVNDADVGKFMRLFTFLSIEEIEKLTSSDINAAKERLAYEVTLLIHGKEAADEALSGARAAFGEGTDRTKMPSYELDETKLNEGLRATDLFFMTGLSATKSEARRLIEQGGAYVNGKSLNDVNAVLDSKCQDESGDIILRAGKKRMMRVVVK